MSDGEDVSQCVDFEFVEVFVDDVVEERFQLNDARVDFCLFLLKKGFVTGLI
jgi:septin family protein